MLILMLISGNGSRLDLIIGQLGGHHRVITITKRLSDERSILNIIDNLPAIQLLSDSRCPDLSRSRR